MLHHDSNFANIPESFRPKIPLRADIVKDTESRWEAANEEIALVILPTLAHLPYGIEINSTMLDEGGDATNIRRTWVLGAKMVLDAHDQYDSNFENTSVIKT